jgi:Dyp-type peroxidase family
MANTNILFTDTQIRDIQGLLFSGYGNLSYCSYYLLAINDVSKVRPWLKQLVAERITQGEPDPENRKKSSDALNLAFGKDGLTMLGIDTSHFEQAYQDGMHSPSRATILGDAGDNDAKQWLWGNEAKPVHLLLMLYSLDEPTHSKRQREEEAALKKGGLSCIQRLDTVNLVDKEHFGFADGISQPLVAGFPSKKLLIGPNQPQAPKIIPTGEFILGYPNGYDGKVTNVPGDPAKAEDQRFGFNGTYLVFRHMAQDVPGFWEFIHAEAEKQKIDPDYLAAKMVGRWKNGAVVEPKQTMPPRIGKDKLENLNFFDFRDDLDGKGCPFGSHVRRTNPRGQGLGVEAETAPGTPPEEKNIQTSLTVANRHRIIRRGRSYGNFLNDPLNDDPVGERGLFFICLNATIERQFEFVQHTWVNNQKFNGLYDEDDPIIGTSQSSDPDFKRRFTIQDEPVRRKASNFQQFVNIKGGSYFFLPGIKALRSLGE